MISSTRLDNGLTVITKKDNNSKIATISYLVKCGSYNESEDELGIAHFTEHMLFKGTTTRSSKDISRSIESVGGYFNAETGQEYTKYYCTMPADHWEIGLDVLSDMIWNNSIPEDEFEKEKQVIIEELKMYDDDSYFKVYEQLLINIYYNHKNKQFNGGTIETVSNISRDKMIEFIDKFYTPNNMFVIATGNVDHDKLVNFLNNYIDVDILYEHSKELEKPIMKRSKLMESTIERDITQAHLAWGLIGPDPSESHILDVIEVILGGNSSSILYQKIREELGLAYSVQTYLQVNSDSCLLTGCASLDYDNLDLVKEIILKELDNIKNNKISTETLNEAITYIKGNVIISLDKTSSYNVFICDALINNTSLYVEDYFDKLDKITPEDIIKLTNKYFNRDNIYFSKIIPK